MKKKSLETLLYSAAGVIAMAVVLIGANLIFGVLRYRADLTEEKAYTLSAGTRQILKKLDTPVRVRFYFTQTEAATPETVFLNSYARKVEDLLAEYRQAGDGKVIIEKYDPQPDSDAEDSARLDGVEPQMLSNGEQVYLGLAVGQLDEKHTIPFLAPNRERLLEYDLSRAIAKVISPEKPVVGIMSPLPVFGMPSNPMMMRMGQQGQEPWAIISELQNDYTVRRVEMNTDKIDDDVRVLMVIHPREISDAAQYAIDQFVLRGGKLIAFLDPLPLMDSREQNQMLGNIPNSGSNLDKLLRTWGLSFDTSKVVADLNYKMQIGGRGGQPQDAPAFLSVKPDGINSDDVITSQLDNVWLPFAGAFTGSPATGLKQTVLLESTEDSQLVEGMMAQFSGPNILKDFKSSGTAYNLAVKLTGKFKTAFPDGKPKEASSETDTNAAPAVAEQSLKESSQENTVVLVGDADMIFDHFALRQVQSLFGNLAVAMNGNLSFAQNAVEQMTGDSNLITVRSRAARNRPFTVVGRMQAEAEERYRNTIKTLEDSLADTQRQLNELQQNKDKSQRFILSAEQQQALENFRKKEADVKKQLKDERKKLRRDIDSLENRLKWFNIAAMPLVVSISGLALAYYKRKRTSAK